MLWIMYVQFRVGCRCYTMYQVRVCDVQKDAVFRYDHAGADAFTLTVPEFSVAPGEVVAVVGRVGAGKSALLQALLGNVPLAQGSMRVGGRVAYVPQVCTCLRIQSCPDIASVARCT